jgi:Fur family ferric uptake transcriptional regulator
VPSLNLSTVYRQIRALEVSGEIVRVELPGQPARFEMAHRGPTAPHSAPTALTAHAPHTDHRHPTGKRGAAVTATEPAHHHHFHCVECDRVYPIHACPGPMLDLAPPGFEVQRHDLTLRGRCADCATGSITGFGAASPPTSSVYSGRPAADACQGIAFASSASRATCDITA